jgi:hypothetical protein
MIQLYYDSRFDKNLDKVAAEIGQSLNLESGKATSPRMLKWYCFTGATWHDIYDVHAYAKDINFVFNGKKAYDKEDND